MILLGRATVPVLPACTSCLCVTIILTVTTATTTAAFILLIIISSIIRTSASNIYLHSPTPT